MIYYAFRLDHSENLIYLQTLLIFCSFQSIIYCSGERSFMYYTYVKGVVSLSHLSNFQNKNKYLAIYEFSTSETLTYDAKCISLFSLLGYILFHCYYTPVAYKNSHGVSMAYKFSMAYFSRSGVYWCSKRVKWLFLTMVHRLCY